MSDNTLTNEEKRCLQYWMRSAIIELEQKRVHETLLKRGGIMATNRHNSVVGRRVRRSRLTSARPKALV
jgi:hypothetical protein